MSVLVFIEHDGGAVKKSSLEAVAYGAKIASELGKEAVALAMGSISADALAVAGNYGIGKVLHAADEKLDANSIMPTATLIGQVAEQQGAELVIASRSSLVDAVAPRVAIKLGADVAANVVELPNLSSGFVVKRGVYTGKAFAEVALKRDRKVLTLAKNAIGLTPGSDAASVEAIDVSFDDNDFAITITNVKKAEGDVLLPEADRVVSAGRGLKGPENWGMIESLAKTLGAATACSKPVSDSDWRPHHEHVGQTGVKVSPSLYIAVGISGAIQHLAGVSSSKTIVVINKDADAPFFKSADYGIVGDAFEVIPKLEEAIKAASN